MWRFGCKNGNLSVMTIAPYKLLVVGAWFYFWKSDKNDPHYLWKSLFGLSYIKWSKILHHLSKKSFSVPIIKMKQISLLDIWKRKILILSQNPISLINFLIRTSIKSWDYNYKGKWKMNKILLTDLQV